MLRLLAWDHTLSVMLAMMEFNTAGSSKDRDGRADEAKKHGGASCRGTQDKRDGARSRRNTTNALIRVSLPDVTQRGRRATLGVVIKKETLPR